MIFHQRQKLRHITTFNTSRNSTTHETRNIALLFKSTRYTKETGDQEVRLRGSRFCLRIFQDVLGLNYSFLLKFPSNRYRRQSRETGEPTAHVYTGYRPPFLHHRRISPIISEIFYWICIVRDGRADWGEVRGGDDDVDGEYDGDDDDDDDDSWVRYRNAITVRIEIDYLYVDVCGDRWIYRRAYFRYIYIFII